jgi:predicted ATPase/DNA-binding winged helix-turn-helix (wHTH) protein
MSEQKQGIYEFYDFQLDLGKGVLLRRGEPVSLQWKTFELLCLLVRSNGSLISRDELINELWADTFVEENNLSQHVRALRKTLGDGENGRQLIETVPRRGYRFLPSVRLFNSVQDVILPDTPEKVSTEFLTSIHPQNDLFVRSPALIGREKQIAEIRSLLQCDDVRILTLTGVGGTGKTTLALAVTREIAGNFKDGVFFVEFAAVTNPELVASTIAQALGVKETGGKPIIKVLKEYLQDQQMLIVADNFEQILSAAPILAEIVKAAPKLKILVTSRARLYLSTDREFVVPPLNVPEISGQNSLEALAKNESVRLFTVRASFVNPNFSLTEENAESITEICVRLDGLPLAIELAAARVRIITPKLILEKLEDRLNLLTGGARDLPARQQTVRGTIEWSYELLNEEEKRLLRRLGVFAGGFTFAAAEAVCSKDKFHKEEIKVLDSLTSLLDKSLLVLKEQPDDEPRFRMLEVVREYALELLETSGEAEAIRRSHAAYFLMLGEEAEPHLQGEKSVEWLNRLEEEHDNLRVALRWSLENDAEIAARLAAAIRFFWIFHAHLTEGQGWLKTALERADNSPPNVRLKLLNGIGIAARNRGDYETARLMHEEVLADNCEAAGIHREITISIRGLGTLARLKGDFAQARISFQKAWGMSRKLNDRSEIAHSLSYLGNLERTEGNNLAAHPLFAEALIIYRDLNNKEGESAILNNLGIVNYEEGNYELARSYLAEGLVIARNLRDKIGISCFLDGFAALYFRRRELQIALRLAGAAEHLRQSIGYELDFSDRSFREQYISKLRVILSEIAFAEFYEQGRKLELEEAIKLALEV